MVGSYCDLVIVRAIDFPPQERGDEVGSSKNFVAEYLKIVTLIVIDLYENRSVYGK